MISPISLSAFALVELPEEEGYTLLVGSFDEARAVNTFLVNPMTAAINFEARGGVYGIKMSEVEWQTLMESIDQPISANLYLSVDRIEDAIGVFEKLKEAVRGIASGAGKIQ